MNALWSRPEFQVVVLVVFAIVFVIALVAVTLAKFYRRCGADEALVRTGSGGNRVVIGGGITVYPILHQLMRVSLRSVKLEVERSGKNALVTKDKMRANVTTELFIKVEPIQEDVLAAARSFGERNLDEHAIGALIEGKLTDALRSVSANSTFMDLHGQRKEFAEAIQIALFEELKKNGLTLENVSITALAMVPVRDLDPADVFDAEGLRAITDSVQSNAEKTNQITREKELAIKLQNVEARKRGLALEQDQAQTEADRARETQEYSAKQQAETARAVYAQQKIQEIASLEKLQQIALARISQEQAVAVSQAARLLAEREAQIAMEKGQQTAEIARSREIEAATIEKDKTVQAAEIDRQKALEAATIEKQKVIESNVVAKEQAVETARIAKQIAVTQGEEHAARAAALRAQAEAEREQAMQAIVTVEAVAKAKRMQEIAVIKAEEEAQQSRIAAEREAYRLKLEADVRAGAMKAQADGEANAKRAAAEGEIARAKGAAEAQLLSAQASADVVRAQVSAEADRVRVTAEARATAATQEAAALIALAEATRQRGEADAGAKRMMVDAENQLSTRFLLRDVALRALDVLPAVTRELMSPALAIREIKVLQMQGLNGNGNGSADGASANGGGAGGMLGAASPVMKTLMEAGAAYPIVREMMRFAQVDGDALADRARDLLNALPAELKKVIDEDPALAAKVAGLVGENTSIGVRAVPISVPGEAARGTRVTTDGATPAAPAT